MSPRYTLALALLLCCGCSGTSTENAEQGQHAGHAGHAEQGGHVDHSAHAGHSAHADHGAHADHVAMDMAEPSGESIFLLDSEWTRQDGEAVTLSTVRGHPSVILMFYGTCEAACPILIHDLQQIDEALGEQERAQVRYLLVTFDPERDTVQSLAQLARGKEMDDRYTLLRGSEEQIRALSMALGVRYRRTPSGEFSHSNVLTLLDREGVVTHRVEGLNTEPDAMVARIRDMLTSG